MSHLIPIKKKTNKNIYVIIKNITEFQERKESYLYPKKQETFNELEDICNFYYDAINDFHYLSKQFPIIFGINADKQLFPYT